MLWDSMLVLLAPMPTTVCEQAKDVRGEQHQTSMWERTLNVDGRNQAILHLTTLAQRRHGTRT